MPMPPTAVQALHRLPKDPEVCMRNATANLAFEGERRERRSRRDEIESYSRGKG